MKDHFPETMPTKCRACLLWKCKEQVEQLPTLCMYIGCMWAWVHVKTAGGGGGGGGSCGDYQPPPRAPPLPHQPTIDMFINTQPVDKHGACLQFRVYSV